MKYTHVVIRIAFKNRLVLQGFFRPKEPVSALYTFVRESFAAENSPADLDFYLFSTPPKIVLSDMKKSLFEAHLCPATLVYFKNTSDQTPLLKKDLIENLTTLGEANELVRLNVHDQMRDIKHEGLDWLEKEQNLAMNIMKPMTSMMSNRQEAAKSTYRQDMSGSINSDNQGKSSDVNKKLERFLKGSKK